MGCLNIIHDSVQTMSTDEIKDLVKTALGSGNHMIDILNDILNQSKNKYLSTQPVKHTIRLTTLMDEIQSPLAVLAQSLAVDLTFEFNNREAEADVVCAVDRTKCIQISTNIINNALKFAKHSKVCVKAEVLPTLQKCVALMEEWSPRFDGIVFSMKESEMLTSFDDAQMFVEDFQNSEDKLWLSLIVSDLGSGMKANELQQMFEPYTQGDSGWRDNRFQGTGLGLFISVSLCHQLGGFISCLSTHGVGTTFHIGIPVEVAHGKEAFLDKEEIADTNRSKENTRIPLASCILIVDDNKVNLKILRLSLEQELKKAEKHVDVIMADGGQVAVQKYRTLLPSVVISTGRLEG
jgi:signal transduction histidine kinase